MPGEEMKHKSLLVYVPCLEGGCKDIGRVELDGHTLVSDERLWDLEAAEKATDEIESLQRYRTAYNEWIDKTEWVQEGMPAKYLGMHRADILKDMVSELLGRLEAAESTRRDDYQNWMTALDRNAELLTKLKAAEKEREIDEQRIADLMAELNRVGHENDKLRAKVAEMEQQEPVAWTTKLALEYGASRLGFQVSGVNIWGENGVPLYALPGAQGEEK